MHRNRSRDGVPLIPSHLEVFVGHIILYPYVYIPMRTYEDQGEIPKKERK